MFFNIFIVIGPILIGFGGYVLFGLVRQIVNALRSRHWTGRVTGVITRRGQEQLKFPGSRQEQRVFQMSVVEYEYVVDSQTYQSGNIAFTPRRVGSGSRLSRIVSDLEPGKEVEVCYNQHRPSEAVLSPGTEPMEWGAVFGGLAFTALFIGVGAAIMLGLFD